MLEMKTWYNDATTNFQTFSDASHGNHKPQSGDAAMSITRELKTAIARSVSHNEIVSVTIDGDSGDALAAIDTLIDSDTVETDYVMIDHEGVDRMDIWAAKIDDTSDDMLWRLSIRFAE